MHNSAVQHLAAVLSYAPYFCPGTDCRRITQHAASCCGAELCILFLPRHRLKADRLAAAGGELEL
jgi:hypothetical protein